MLTARGADPRHATLPPGHDPASLLHTAGPDRATPAATRRPRPWPTPSSTNDSPTSHQPPPCTSRPAPSSPPVTPSTGMPRTSRHRPPPARTRRRRPHPTACHTSPSGTATGRTASNRLSSADVPETRDRITGLANQKPRPTVGTARPPDRPSLDPRPRLGRPRRNDRPARPGRHRHADPAAPNRRPGPLSNDEPAKDLRHRLAACLDPPDEPTLTYPAQGTDQTQPYRPHGPRIPAARPTPDSSPPRR